MPLYPLYALLFLDAGVSAGELSLLFGLWSVTGLVAEVPAGLLADRWSRRGVLFLAGVLQAAAFVVWTVAPSTGAFALGFVLWGLAGAGTSGTAEAVVHDGLAEVGAAGCFARVNAAMTAAELLVQVPTALAATALHALGGFALVGWVSAALCLAAAGLALRFPGATVDGGDDDDPSPGPGAALRRPALLAAVVAVALVGGLDGMEEYFPVLVAERGVPALAVPTAVLVVSLAGAAGAALGGRLVRPPGRLLGALLVAAGAGLLLAAATAGLLVVAALGVAYGVYLAVLVAAEAELQRRISGPYRATITSVAGVGVELSSLLVFAAWACGGSGAVALLVLAVVPAVAVGLRRRC
ncbi:MFS transporter [Blastococcus sp. BMG 814]|uniref:MFS transporter n=1 Tax=Blastococcus carthaginiensis TaxID=3050034 RepID=A0ABT9IH03_9ACTN|nr:MFS transporter [Blastococcus carthaginiensis]MDP5184845.1 MFS transporter [Blastococcus carthaginiensis]